MVRKQLVGISAVFLLSLLSILFLLLATHHGVGLSPDSLVYVAVARNVADGRGVTTPFGTIVGADTPMTHRAPFYALLLAGGDWMSLDALEWARWLQTLIFGGNIFLVGWLALTLCQGSWWTAVFAAFFMLTSLTMLTVHAYAWSEGIFILLGFVGLVWVARFISNGRYLWLFGAAISLGLANFTRYAGLPFTAVATLAILLWGGTAENGRSFLHRLLDAVLLGLVSILPLVAWFYRNAQVGSTATSRQFAFHPVETGHFFQALNTVSFWLLVPATLPTIVKLGVLFVAGGLLLFAAIRHERHQPRPTTLLPRILGLFVVVYGGFLLVSVSFFDANTPFDERILSPVFVAGILLVTYYASAFVAENRLPRWAKGVGTAVLLLFALAYLFNAIRWMNTAQTQGLGFSGVNWQNTNLAPAIAQLPDNALIFSNAPDVVYILTGRSAHPLPKPITVTTGQENEMYADEMHQVEKFLFNANGYIIIFNSLGAAAQIEQELLTTWPLTVKIQTNQGTIYAYIP
jgi:hypothetical protein